MRLLFSVFLAVASLSLIQAHQNVSTILPHCDHQCTFEAFNESNCTNHTCACKDSTYAAVFNKCETKNCTTAEQNVTKAYALIPCSQIGRHTKTNSTLSSTVARVSGTATSTGTSIMTHNSSTMHNGTFMGSPPPFTGGSGVATGCGAMVIAGILVGGMAATLL